MSTSSPPTGHAVQGGLLGLPGAKLEDILDAVLSRGAPVRFQARGFSMHPTIRDLDLVTVSPIALQKDCANLIDSECQDTTCDHLIHCGAGNVSFVVGYDGTFRLCSSVTAAPSTSNGRRKRTSS